MTLTLKLAMWTRLGLLALTAMVMAGLPARALGADGPVKLRATPDRVQVSPGGTVTVTIELDFGDKYHAWPEKSVALPAELDEFAIRTEIKLAEASPKWLMAEAVKYPATHDGKVPNPSGLGEAVTVPLYSGKAIATVPVKVAADAPGGSQSIEVLVSYQACDEAACLPPEDVTLKVAIEIVGGKAAATTAPAAGPTITFLGWNVGGSLLILAFCGALGGIVLNLTPCVLPVIPIKILTLVQHAGSRKRSVIMGAWMGLGVVLFWTLAGLPMAVWSRAADPSQLIFGIWWVTVSLGLIVALMSLGIMGLFVMNLPQWVYSVESKTDSPLSALFYGVMTAVLGLPCFGFVVGGLLAGASVMSAGQIMAVFVGLGIGMAAPYAVLAAFPKLLRFVPRAGPASDLVKQVLGLLLLAAAGFFIAAGIKGLLLDMPWLTGVMTWWVVAFFVVIAGVWLAVRTFKISAKAWPRLAMSAIAVLLMLGSVWWAYDKSSIEKRTHDELIAAQKKARDSSSGGTVAVVEGVWMPFTTETLEAARKQGKPVFLDFTADWCNLCKVLKRQVLDRDPALSRFKASGVVLLEVDCTSRNTDGSKFLSSLGRTGVPTWVVYGPGSNEPLVIDANTSENVLSTLDRAGVPKATAGASGAENPRVIPTTLGSSASKD